MFNGLFKSKSVQEIDQRALDDFVDNALSWLDLEKILASKESAEEKDNFALQQVGRGSTSSLAKIRLFDAEDGFDPEITLYRDSAAWCPYCEKVWLYLEEKRVPYKVEKVPLRCYGEKPSSFFTISPSGSLPAAIIKGRSMTESNDIIFTVEREFTGKGYPAMFPSSSSPQLQRAQELMRLERQVFSVWFSWLTSASDREIEMRNALLRVDAALQRSDGPFFLGPQISVVDCLFAPFLERMVPSLLYYKGMQIRGGDFPHIDRWFEHMEKRDSYRGIKSDYYTHVHALPPQIGPCVSTPKALPFQQLIDGGDWANLSSPPLEAPLPPSLPVCAREAARRLLVNRQHIARFMARGWGAQSAGSKVSAPLADPHLQPSPVLLPALDSLLRHLVLQLLSYGDATESGESSAIASPIVVPEALRPPLLACLTYLQQRIGVPRDVRVGAGRIMRGEIGKLVRRLE
eukprot:gene26502-32026_t